MFDARIRYFRQSTAIVLFDPFSLQSKQLQPDYVSSYNNSKMEALAVC